MKHYKRWHKYGDPTILKTVSYVQEPTKVPTDMDIAWAAGFLEGEGCFDKGNQSQRVGIFQVHKPPVERMQALFGGSLILKKRRNPKHSDVWKWSVCGQNARDIMSLVYTQMSPKRQAQIDKARS